jgi:hypothetical protein
LPEINFHLSSYDEPDLNPLSEDPQEWDEAAEHLTGTKIGGKPYWIQYEEYPGDEEIKRLLVQIECDELERDEGGTMYVFIDEKGTKGRFLYQR